MQDFFHQPSTVVVENNFNLFSLPELQSLYTCHNLCVVQSSFRTCLLFTSSNQFIPCLQIATSQGTFAGHLQRKEPRLNRNIWMLGILPNGVIVFWGKNKAVKENLKPGFLTHPSTSFIQGSIDVSCAH